MPSKIQYKLSPFLYSDSSLSPSSVCFVFHMEMFIQSKLGQEKYCIGDKIV